MISRKKFAVKTSGLLRSHVAIQSKLDEKNALPEDLKQWLGRLRLLQGVPFRYLVPDEEMLPPESIRFFRVDTNWLNAVADGAYSIGRNLTGTAEAVSHNMDMALSASVHKEAHSHAISIRTAALGLEKLQTDMKVVTGFLLRSSLVRRYRGLGVMAYKDENKTSLLNILRLERLGEQSDVLICLIDGDTVVVDVHEAPEQLHYGIKSYLPPKDSEPAGGNKVIQLFETKDGKVIIKKETADIDLKGMFRKGAPRTLRLGKLAEEIAAKNKLGRKIDSAEMGFEMTEGVGMVSFKNKRS